jgi:hypothetical protein
MPRTDERGQHGDESEELHAGLQGVNLPAIPFHGSKEEQLRLIRAVRTHIGPCECHVHTDMFGNVCEGHPCAGHQFLCETDEPGRKVEWAVSDVFGFTHFTTGALSHRVTRLDRLMFARTMKFRWASAEMGRPVSAWPPLETPHRNDRIPDSRSLLEQALGDAGISTNPEDFPW